MSQKADLVICGAGIAGVAAAHFLSKAGIRNRHSPLIQKGSRSIIIEYSEVKNIMPIRIKPQIDLGPCVLTLKSMEGITELVTKEFSSVFFSAADDIWEIYGEKRPIFIEEISKHNKLDEFTISIVTDFDNLSESDKLKEINIVFNQTEATVTCYLEPSQQNRVEHFIIDLKKHILPPSFSQRTAELYRRAKIIPFLPELEQIPIQLMVGIPNFGENELYFAINQTEFCSSYGYVIIRVVEYFKVSILQNSD